MDAAMMMMNAATFIALGTVDHASEDTIRLTLLLLLLLRWQWNILLKCIVNGCAE
jgi:hypothetical protein